MPAEGRENPLLKKGNSDAFFKEKYLTKNTSVFLAEEIYKIVEEYPMPMEERNQLADRLSGIPAFAGDKFISNLRNPEFPYTTHLADIDGREKQWVREAVCAEWERANPGYDISFYDEEGNLLCKADNRIKNLIHMSKN